MNNTSFVFLIAYCVLWAVVCFVYTRKRKGINAATIILWSYFIYSICSVLLYGRTSYFLGQETTKIGVFPFIYLFAFEMLFLVPVFRASIRCYKIEVANLQIVYGICLIWIISSLIHLPASISSFREGFIRILTDTSGGADLYAEKMEFTSGSGGGITNLFSIFSQAFSGLGVLFLFYSFTQVKFNKWIRWGLIISYLVSLLNGISSGQRGLIVEPVYVALVTYFFFRAYMDKSINRVISVGGVLIVLALAVPFAALTISRFDTASTDTTESLLFYAGQQNIYFNCYALDDGGIRYGDRTIPLFKRMLGFSNVPKNFWERRFKYPNLKINDEVFYTYVGDFTIDYGPFVGTLIMLLMIFFFISATRPSEDGKLRFYQIILLHFLLYMCMMGGLKLFPFSDVGGNLKIIVYFTAYLVFKYGNSSKQYEYGRS